MSAAPAALAQDLIGFDPASFGSVILKQKQTAAGDVVHEMAVGAYNNEFISAYSPKSVFAKMGRSVGRLDVLTDKGNFPCTAFLVADDLLMTNHHCVPGILDDTRIGANAIAAVQFVTGYTQEGIATGTEKFMVNPIPVETNKDLDYSVLRILGAKPGKKHGTLRLASLQPQDNDPYWIIGHPMGEAQRISREKCRANAPALSESRLLHTCDTLPGNSGSPVIDASSQMVIALHHAGSRANSVNFAVPMSLILANSKVLVGTQTGGGNQASKPDTETLALGALSRAISISETNTRIAALETLVAQYDGTAAATTAHQLLAVLKMPVPKPQPQPQPVVTVDPEPQPQPKPVVKVDPEPQAPSLSVNERMVADADVQRCDRLAGTSAHPDYKADIMVVRGVDVDDIRPDTAIAACRAALQKFPDHPRMLAFLTRALLAANEHYSAVRPLHIAAESGDPLAQNNLGIFYENGHGGLNKSAEDAVTWYRKSAEQGFAIAQSNLGIMYLEGHGTVKSESSAARWFQKAADQGDTIAALNLGRLYRDGDGVSRNLSTSTRYFRKAANAGNADAQYNVGLAYANGNGVSKSTSLAAQNYRKAANQGHMDAQYQLGRAYAYGTGVGQSWTTARSYYDKAAAQGHGSANYALGNIYYYGDGVTKNNNRALSYYRKAADKKVSDAYVMVGLSYSKGYGVTKDEKTAVTWYRKAAAADNTQGQFNLGVMYSNGRGVTQSKTTAKTWYLKAANKGHAAAQTNLGVLYYMGQGGITKDYKEAVKWYRKAAGKKHATALTNMGMVYAKGHGVTKDAKLAASYYIRGLKGGSRWLLDRDARNWDADTAREFQRKMKEEGVYDGAIDGAIGPQSVASMRKLLP
ncbi:trypsin-like peptidase domain-containing protein [Antarctobacter jejuensis]|uniref:trypsin-like peptidase domain-containing protein n=1 Tax=Antarctobacter jejuensis TaxID=1439938 RepID=UPI003FCFED2E